MSKTATPAQKSAAALMLPLQLEHGRAPGLSVSILVIGSLFVAATAIWSAITQINELTIAPGQLRPAGFIHAVQHLEGGLVQDIFVSEGQIVDPGMPILRLQPIQAAADLEQLRARRAALMLRIERLSALIENRSPDFGDSAHGFPQIRANELDAFDAAKARHSQERQSLRSQIDQRRAEAKAITEQVASLKRQLALLSEQLELRRDLVKKGYVSKSQYLEIERDLERLNEQLILATGQGAAADEALKETQIKLKEYEHRFASELSEERAKASGELGEVSAVSPKQEDRVERLLVRAPVRGVVQELIPKSVGQVIKPGELIASIVPLDAEIVAEVQLPPQDIGYVKTGQEADVQISAFDSVRFGKLPGVVSQISATTFITPEGEPYYKAVINLDRGYVTFAGQQHRIMPGMVVQAEISTGAKSLMAYMLKPIYNNYSTAFSER